MSRNTKMWIVMLVMTLIGIVFSGEAFLRVFVAREEHPVKHINYSKYKTMTPNDVFNMVNEEEEHYPVITDSYGLRNDQDAIAHAEVIILGDSFIVAYNTVKEKSFVGHMLSEGMLAYNAGVAGSSTFEQISLFKFLLKDAINIKVVLIAFYLGNDYRDNYLMFGNYFDLSTGSKQAGLYNGFKDVFKMSRFITWLYETFYLGVFKGLSEHPFGSYAKGEMIVIKENDDLMQEATERTRKAFAELSDIVRD